MECFTNKLMADTVSIVVLLETEFTKFINQQADTTKNWLDLNQFTGQADQSCLIPDHEGQLKMVVVGLGAKKDIYALARIAKELPSGSYQLDDSFNKYSHEALNLVYLMFGLENYRFTKYHMEKKLTAQLVMHKSVDQMLLNHWLSSIYLARDMINTPCEDMGPADVAGAVKSIASEFNADVNLIVGDDLLTENYPTIHLVGRAAARPPILADMRWGDPTHPKVTLVGKGVCFDSGGLDIKSTAGMRQMKKDMGGAASAIALAHMIMAQKLPVRLRLLIPTVENSISGNAYRPGDIVKTRAGITVEVTNTDAEGRLILCDALFEACQEQPDYLFDFATLTGAARIALGAEISALFSNDDVMAHDMQKLSFKIEDPAWQLPLYQPYSKLLTSKLADSVNAAEGVQGFGGSITAALYLQQFVSGSCKWAHFDTYGSVDKAEPGRPIGGEPGAIRTVYQYLQAHVLAN